jgi:NAD(P)-dependent dehydrogenase (short-subunit alcohol dehydrogenase family)
MTQVKTALVTGANRGIGRATALRFANAGYHVIVGVRDAENAAPVIDQIRAAGGSAESIQIDMGDTASIAHAAKILGSRHTQIDVIVNNAAINLNMMDNILVATSHDIDASLRTNAIGPLELVKALLPQIKSATGARIVNVSSSAGSVTETADPVSPYAYWDTASYRLSKSALNMITAMLAKTLRDDGIKVNAMCPGWTATDMGGAEAPNTPEQAAELAFKLGTLDSNGATGAFFNASGPIAW